MRTLEIVLSIAILLLMAVILSADGKYVGKAFNPPLPTAPPTLDKQVIEGCTYIIQLDTQKTTITSSYAAVGQPSTCLYDARKPR